MVVCREYVKKIDIEGAATPYRVLCQRREGAGQLTVLLHGLGCSVKCWQHAWDHAELGSLLAIDLPGFGRSEKTDAFAHDLSALAAVVDTILGDFADRQLRIVAHSMGGAVALLLNRATWSRTTSFINVEGNLAAADCGMVSRAIATVTEAEFVDSGMAQLRERLRDEPGFDLETASALAMHRCARSLVSWSEGGELLARYLDLPCQRTYVCGDRNLDAVQRSLPAGERLRVVAASGHFPMIDNPDAFYRLIATV